MSCAMCVQLMTETARASRRVDLHVDRVYGWTSCARVRSRPSREPTAVFTFSNAVFAAKPAKIKPPPWFARGLMVNYVTRLARRPVVPAVQTSLSGCRVFQVFTKREDCYVAATARSYCFGDALSCRIRVFSTRVTAFRQRTVYLTRSGYSTR